MTFDSTNVLHSGLLNKLNMLSYVKSSSVKVIDIIISIFDANGASKMLIFRQDGRMDERVERQRDIVIVRTASQLKFENSNLMRDNKVNNI